MNKKKKKNSDTKLRNVRRSKYDVGRVKKYSTAGMYTDNTVSAAGQGNNTTANIVFNESNPQELENRINNLNAIKNQLNQQNQEISEEIKADDAAAQDKINAAALEEKQKTEQIGGTIKALEEGAETLGLKKKQSLKDKLGITKITDAYKGTRAANLAAKSTEVIDGSNVITNAAMADKAIQALPEGHQIMSSAETGKTIVVDAGGNIVKQGSAIGSSLKAAAANPNVLALAAQYGGKGIKALADDDDETTWTFGEATGDTLSKAGEYAGYGAMIGSVVPGVGNAVGAGIGAVIGTGVGIYQGLTGRNKAREEEERLAREKKAKTDKYNKEVREKLFSATASARAGEIEQKTYSGYDLGRNVVAKTGGMRLGIPRY